MRLHEGLRFEQGDITRIRGAGSTDGMPLRKRNYTTMLRRLAARVMAV
jgi:hypothetical protein